MTSKISDYLKEVRQCAFQLYYLRTYKYVRLNLSYSNNYFNVVDTYIIFGAFFLPLTTHYKYA